MLAATNKKTDHPTHFDDTLNFFYTVALWVAALLVTMAFQQAITHTLDLIPNVDDKSTRNAIDWLYAFVMLALFSVVAKLYADHSRRTGSTLTFNAPVLGDSLLTNTGGAAPPVASKAPVAGYYPMESVHPIGSNSSTVTSFRA